MAARQRRTQYGRLTKNQEEDAQGSVLQEVWRGHEQDRQGGPHGERFTREVHGHAADETEGFQDHCWKVPPGHTRGTVAHLAARDASVRPDTHVQDRANRSVGRGSVGRAAGRRRSAQGMEATAATGGPEAVVEQSQRPHGRPSSCVRSS